MAKIAKRTIGIALAIAFSLIMLSLALLAAIFLVAYMKNIGI